MKKIIFILTVLMICGTAYADNSARIEELEILFGRCEKEVSRLAIRKSEIITAATMAKGAIEELKRQDAEAKKVSEKSVDPSIKKDEVKK